MTNQEQALAIAVRIAEGEAELRRLKTEFASFVPEGPRVVVAPKASAAPSKGGLAPERVFEEISKRPVGSLSPAVIALALPDLDRKLVQNAMIRLAKIGKLEKLERGRYRLAVQAKAG